MMNAIISCQRSFIHVCVCLVSADRPLTDLEMRAKMRDMKRRRQSYRGKSTHTSKKNYTEVLFSSMLNCFLLFCYGYRIIYC